MTPDLKAFIASACLHLLAIGGALAFDVFPSKTSAPLEVDLTIEAGQLSDTVAQGGNPGAASSPAPVFLRSFRQQAERPVAESFEAPPAPPNETVPAPASVPAVSAAQSGAVTASAASSGGGSPSSVSTLPGGGGPGHGTGTGADTVGAGAGSRGESAEALRARYLRTHFGYIRDLINGNLRYPGKARRMGWSGALKVEFVVREDGSAAAIRVAKSSGVPLLDSDAEETVRRSAPFPKPPVSARLVIPVEYILE